MKVSDFLTSFFSIQSCASKPRTSPLEAGKRYYIKHTTRGGRAIIDELRYRIDVNTLHRDGAATTLGLNEIGRVHLRTSTPLMVDEYRLNRATGSFILIDEATNDTVGAGMIVDPGTGGASVVDAVAEGLSEEPAAA